MKYVFIAVLVIAAIIVIFPPVYYHYIYPTSGDDTATHLIYFENMRNNNNSDFYNFIFPTVPPFPLYWGQYIVGQFINMFNDQVKVFMWFNYGVLILGLWIVGLVVSKTVNYLAGIIAVIMVLGRSFLLTLFNWGNIFDVFNVIIILPIVLYCLHNISKGKKWIAGLVISGILFGLFHTTGKYLYALIPIIIVYEVGVW